MTLEELRENVRRWDSTNYDNEAIAAAKYTSISIQIEHHAENEWKVYLPAEHPDSNTNYMERLARWVGNVKKEEEQKLLLEYALHISFFSHGDFLALYRTALHRVVYPWLMVQAGLKLDDQGQRGFK